MKKFDLTSYFSSRDTYDIIERMEGKTGFGIGVGEIFPFDSVGKMKLIDKEEEIKRDASKEIRCEYELQGLKIGVNYHYFPEGNILSLSGKIVNDTNQPISNFFRISSFLQSFHIKDSERVRIHSFKGGIADFRYPPISFTHRESELVSWITEGTSISSKLLSLANFNGGLKGRSTDNDMPYFVVQIGEGGGVFFALEWAGDWSSSIKREKEAAREKLICEIGLEHLDLNVLSQERIPLPGCLVGFYKGEWIDGSNTLKKAIAKYYTPKLNGRSIVPPVFYNHWFGLGLNCGEKKMMEVAKVASQIGSEYFVLDAGWYAGCKTKGKGIKFSQGIGNWEMPHPEKYPNGLKPLSEFVNKKGMKFGIWIEPERCDKDSWLAKHHRDWIIPDPKGGFQNLVDFGNSEVVSWFKDTFDKIFEENKVQWIRFDSNIDPYWNWQRKDAPGRKGISQIRHLEGLFNFWDHLLEKHPTLLIEGCSSGGRRMDLACLKRSHAYWCNDHTEHPDIVRWDIGANLIIPANYLSHTICLKSSKDYPDYVYHCLFGGSLGFADDLTTWSAKKIRSATEHVNIFKKIRPLLMKDFSPLLDTPSSLDSWDGWQWHDGEKKQGLIIVFRALSPEKAKRVKLRWIDEDENYELLNFYSGKKKKVHGEKLSSEGLLFNLMPRNSAVIKYRAIGKG